jgi:dihydrofolate reductase
MQKVILDITQSLDGFIAGPNISEAHPLGEGGERLHRWIFDEKTETDSTVLATLVETSGAVIVGGTTYTTAIDGAWNGVSPFSIPAFVVSRQDPKNSVPGFTYVKEGVAEALSKAKSVADDKNVWVMGGANTIQQFLKEGLFDELHLHVVPIILAEGTRLFNHLIQNKIEFTKTRVVESQAVTHLFFSAKKNI